ncbi:MAG: tRNA (guanosine(46)-N7)-methyltransferase TrmB [Hyphomicrobiales bacterium]
MTRDAMKNQERRQLYGRRQGHKLRGRQAALMEELLPQVRIDPLDPRMMTPARLFSPPKEEVWMEIGFGGGEHLVSQARAHSDVGFLGAEPFVNGVAKLLSEIDTEELANVRIYPDDARALLDVLADESIARVFLLYPDPWPKARHNKRRFVSGDNLDRLHRIMKQDGVFRFASDIPDYVRWTLREIQLHGGFEWIAQGPSEWRTPPCDWPGTRYEAKALREGRTPTYLDFMRK